jgi:hypothetical protein
MGEKKTLKPVSLEEELSELRGKLGQLLELCIPPEEVRNEIKRNLITAQVSLLKVFKTLLDYHIETLEKLAEEPPKRKNEREKPKKIKVE